MIQVRRKGRYKSRFGLSTKHSYCCVENAGVGGTRDQEMSYKLLSLPQGSSDKHPSWALVAGGERAQK